MKVPFVELNEQYRTHKAEIDAAIHGVLDQSTYLFGPDNEAFEREYAAYVGVKHCIGVSNGLDALRLALMAYDIGAGNEVIVAANTYIATALAVSAVGATPVPVDCEARSYQIDVSKVESAIHRNTKAIMPVHLTGHSADMDPLLELADKYGLKVIEDAAQAHGTLYKGKPCGGVGDVGCWSFYPGKNLGAYGDGGAVTTNDDKLAERIRRIANYGQRAKYVHVEKGLNARLDTVQAAVLRVKLRHLGEWNARRNEIAERYQELLTHVGDLRFQEIAPHSTHNYHLMVIETQRRDELQRWLTERGVQTNIHYPKPLHLHEAYADLGYGVGAFPVAEHLTQHSLSLPMYPELRDEQVDYVADAIKQFYSSR
jgi:dTDP-4-amino-4,6-dideoxygalactose transaminase